MRGRATDCLGEFGPDAEGPLVLSPDRRSNRLSACRQRACRQHELVEVAHVVPAGTGAGNDPGGAGIDDPGGKDPRSGLPTVLHEISGKE